MAILERPVARGGGGGSLKKQMSLVTLTFQNSALILIMHYSRIMPPSGDHRYFTSTAVFLNEIIKLAVSLALAFQETSASLAPNTPTPVLVEQIKNAVFGGDGWKMAVPAAFYTFQNLLQYVAVGNLDAVHFQILYQVKILTTAIFSVVLLRRPLGLQRWLSLMVLTLGVCVVSLPAESSIPGGSLFLHDSTDHFFPRSLHEMGQMAPELYVPRGSPEHHLSRRSATYEGITEDLGPPEPQMNYSAGVTAVLVAAAVSGLTGVYFEKLLKEGPSQVSVWIRNVQLSFYSLIAALLGGVIWQDGSGILEHGFFEGYNWVVWTAIVLQAVGGMVASIVIRDADNIVKNFATSISIVVSMLVSVMIFDFTVTWTFLLGTSFVLLSTYLYSTPDRKLPFASGRRRRPSPIHIAEFEKPAISPARTPRLGPSPPGWNGKPSRMMLDPLDAGKGLGLSSSTPESPMLPRVPSRGDFKRDS